MEKNNKIEHDGVALTAKQIYLFTQKNSSVLRFAIYNQDSSKIKFLYNDEICKSGRAETRRECDYILYKTTRGSRGFLKRECITNLPSIHKTTSEIKSTIYLPEQVKEMLSIIEPYIKPTCKLPLEEWIEIDKKFSAYQREQLKECECDSSAQTEAYCNF